jgi:hypothetical protein
MIHDPNYKLPENRLPTRHLDPKVPQPAVVADPNYPALIYHPSGDQKKVFSKDVHDEHLADGWGNKPFPPPEPAPEDSPFDLIAALEKRVQALEAIVIALSTPAEPEPPQPPAPAAEKGDAKSKGK